MCDDNSLNGERDENFSLFAHFRIAFESTLVHISNWKHTIKRGN